MAPRDLDFQRTVGTLEYDSAESLRHACVFLASRLPNVALVELLDAVWRITEFYEKPRVPVLPSPAARPRKVILGSVRERPKVWVSEE